MIWIILSVILKEIYKINDQEVWADIPGYVGSYMVSNLGSIKSLDRPWHPGMSLKSREGKDGYLNISLSLNNKKHRKQVHLIVLLAFKGLCPEGKEARHLNGNKTDPKLSNLKYGTHKKNMLNENDMTQKEIGEVFGIYRRTVGKIKLNKTRGYI